MKRKALILSAIFGGVLIILLVATFFHNHSMQSEVRFSNENVHKAYYPISSGMITVANGVRMAFDTASSVSTITDADVRRLRELGYKVEELSSLYFGLDPNDHFVTHTRRYRVELPAPGIRLSDGTNFCSLFGPEIQDGVMIENLTFLPSNDGISHFGIDIIEKFAVEYSWTTGMIVLCDHVPEDYITIAKMNTSLRPSDLLGSADRRYLSLEVDNRTNNFLINTFISRIKLNIPEDDGPRARLSRVDPYMLNGEYVHATREYSQLIKIGNRAKYQDIHRSGANDNREAYFCNPLNMFVNDIIIDFTSDRILMRRGATTISRSPDFGLASE